MRFSLLSSKEKRVDLSVIVCRQGKQRMRPSKLNIQDLALSLFRLRTSLPSNSDNSTSPTMAATPNESSQGHVVYCSTEQEYYQAIDAAGDKLVVVDCFAEWCPPCRQIAPVFDALAREHPDIIFLKVDVDKVPSIKVILGVWAMPSFYFMRGGSKLGSFMGANEALLRRGIANGGSVGICSSCRIQ